MWPMKDGSTKKFDNVPKYASNIHPLEFTITKF